MYCDTTWRDNVKLKHGRNQFLGWCIKSHHLQPKRCHICVTALLERQIKTCSTEMGTPWNEVFPLLHTKPAPSCSYMRNVFHHCCHSYDSSLLGSLIKSVPLAPRTEKVKSCPKHVYKLNFIPFNFPLLLRFHTCHWKYISPLMSPILAIQKSYI